MPVLPTTRAANDKIGRRKGSVKAVSSNSVDVVSPQITRPRQLSVPKAAFDSPITTGAQELGPAVTEASLRLMEAEKREQERDEAVALLEAKKRVRKDLETRQQSLVATGTMSKEELENFGAESTAVQQEIKSSREWSPEGELKLLEMFDQQSSVATGNLSAMAVKVKEATAEAEVRKTAAPFVDEVRKNPKLTTIYAQLDNLEEELVDTRKILNPIKDMEVRDELREQIVLAGLNAVKNTGEVQRAKLMLRDPIIRGSLSDETHRNFLKSFKTIETTKTAAQKNVQALEDAGITLSTDELKRVYGVTTSGGQTIQQKFDEYTEAFGHPPDENAKAKLAGTYVSEGGSSENEKQTKILMEQFGLDFKLAYGLANGFVVLETDEKSGDMFMINQATQENLGKIPKNQQEIVQQVAGENSTPPSQVIDAEKVKQEVGSVSKSEQKARDEERIRILTEEQQANPDDPELNKELGNAIKDFQKDHFGDGESAKTTGKQPEKTKTVDEDGVKITTTTNTEDTGLESTPTAKAEPEDQGGELEVTSEDKKVLDDITLDGADLSVLDAATLASGPVAKVREVVSNFVGPFWTGGALFKDTTDGLQVMRIFRQLAKAAFINNDKFPVKEQETVDKLFANIDKIFIDPDRVRRDMITLNKTLNQFKLNKEKELKNKNTTSRGAADLRDQISTINQVLAMMESKAKPKKKRELPPGVPEDSRFLGTRNGEDFFLDKDGEQWIAPSQKAVSSQKKTK